MFAPSTETDIPSGPDRADLHRALDALLDAMPADPCLTPGSAAAATFGPAGTAAVVAWHQVRTALDDAVVSLLPRWEISGDWAEDGDATAASWLVAHLGLGQTAARALRRTAVLAAPMPHVQAGLRAGRLPGAHLHVLVRARTKEVAEAFDRDEADLVLAARRLQFDAFTRHLAAWRLSALEEYARNEDDPAPGPLTEADRLSVTRTFGGRGLLDGELSPESLAVLSGALDAEIDDWHRTGQLKDRADASRGELQAEALLAIVRRGVRAGTAAGAPRPLLIGLADVDTLLRRTDLTPEQRHTRRAEIFGAGPVDDATIHRLLCEADLSLVITHRGQPLWVGRAERRATAAQLRALLTQSGGTCEWPGCSAPHRHCDAHHLQPWSSGGDTDLPNLALLCHHHHRAIHERGFRVTRAEGRLEVRNRHGETIRPVRPTRTAEPTATAPASPSGPVAA